MHQNNECVNVHHRRILVIFDLLVSNGAFLPSTYPKAVGKIAIFPSIFSLSSLEGQEIRASSYIFKEENTAHTKCEM